MAARISWCTDDVSQLSKALSRVLDSPAGKGTVSYDERSEYRMSFVFDDAGPTRVADDIAIDPPLDTGVLGGEVKVAS